jgi:hypothetical protein
MSPSPEVPKTKKKPRWIYATSLSHAIVTTCIWLALGGFWTIRLSLDGSSIVGVLATVYAVAVVYCSVGVVYWVRRGRT